MISIAYLQDDIISGKSQETERKNAGQLGGSGWVGWEYLHRSRGRGEGIWKEGKQDNI